MLNPDYRRTLYWSNHSGRNEHILEEPLVCLPLATRLLRQTFLGNLMLGEGKGVSNTWGWPEDRLFCEISHKLSNHLGGQTGVETVIGRIAP